MKHEFLRRTPEAADSYFLVKYEFLRRTPAADSYFLVKHIFLRLRRLDSRAGYVRHAL